MIWQRYIINAVSCWLVIIRHGIFMSFCSAKYDVFTYVIFWGVKYVLKMPKYRKMCDFEIQISRGYYQEGKNGFKPFLNKYFFSRMVLSGMAIPMFDSKNPRKFGHVQPHPWNASGKGLHRAPFQQLQPMISSVSWRNNPQVVPGSHFFSASIDVSSRVSWTQHVAWSNSS